jgi:fructose-bisphosphate aldolase class I
MIVPGKDNKCKPSLKEIAKRSLTLAKRSIPVAIPSVVYLSGGLTPERSTRYLDAINELGPHPWELNFSFGRALQQPVLKVWAGKDENLEKAQKEFLKRTRLNSMALLGKYKKEMENE